MSDPNAKAAHAFLAELRTRISVQPLPYQDGDEQRALESLAEIFGHARKAITDNPGCADFARQTSDMLNCDLRPATAKWHPISLEGGLQTRDGSAAFRGDLAAVRFKLRAFANTLHQMAYGTDFADVEAPPAISTDQLDTILADVPFGIPANHLIDDDTRAQINAAEAIEVAARRGGDPAILQNGVGLALSGGGIRSASFCLGACQAMADRQMLADVDIMSTVSGGGYTGAFVSRHMAANPTDPVAALRNRHGPDTEDIRTLRSKAKYMAPSGFADKWAMICSILAGMLLNWTAPAAIICGIIVLLVATCTIWARILPYLSLFAVVTAAAGLLIYAIQLQRDRAMAIRWFSGLAAVATAFFVLAFMPRLYYGFQSLSPPEILSTTFVAIVAAASPALTQISAVLARPMLEKILLRAALVVASIAVPLIGLIFGFAMWDLSQTAGVFPLIVMTAGLGLTAWFAINLNLSSPGRLYQNRLAQSFVSTTAQPESFVPLSRLNTHQNANVPSKAPYHLINTTLNVPNSTSPKLRERRGDFFVMSKHWVGAPSTGYSPTEDWKTSDGELDLATAIATSGAAVSPHMALMSIPSVTALLSFLNIRLGLWLHRPGAKGSNLRPGFWNLLKEMFSWGLVEDSDWFLLSDGAHVDNSGIYELLRRRCKFIIACDASTDTDGGFSTLMTLVRHAQIDFGIMIEPQLHDLGTDPDSGLTADHVMMCQIKYPDHSDGLLLLLKSSITGNEPQLITSYRAKHRDFPNQSTLDQFFDEAQFEAYRQLGVHIVDGLFEPSVVGHGDAPKNVSGWFRRLAANLLPRQT